MDVSSIFPDRYLQELLLVGVRADGRGVDVGRPVAVNIGSISSCDGSSLVCHGNTLVSCGVKLELLSCAAADDKCGLVVCNVDCSSGSSPESGCGPLPSHVQVATRKLQALVDQVLDVTCLPVVGDLVWVLHVDAICLSYHGNLLDACCLAAMAALRDTRLPLVSLEEDGGPVVSLSQSSSPLSLQSDGQVAVSFALFKDWCLLDPTWEEELVSDGTCTVVVKLHPQEVQSCTHQGKVISEDRLGGLVEVACKRAASLRVLLHSATNKQMNCP